MVNKEDLSEFVDGELSDVREESLYRSIRSSDESADTWREYHLIGDLIRGEGQPGLSMDKFREALYAEPTVISARARSPKSNRNTLDKFSKIAASFAIFAVVGWLGISDQSPLDVHVAIKDFSAQDQQVALEAAYDEAIAEYLAVHQQVSPRSLGGGALPDIEE
jgi:sigma-E factor negative regulatory protein RseA